MPVLRLPLKLTLRDLFWCVLLAASLTAWRVQHTRTAREINELQEQSWIHLIDRPSPSSMELRVRMAAMHKFTRFTDEQLDEHLASLLVGDFSRNPEYEPCLTEMARRGMASQLRAHYRQLMQGPLPISRYLNFPDNFALLTALRRAEGLPDPLRIEVTIAERRSSNFDEKAVYLEARVTNVDVKKEAVYFFQGGDYRGGRRERWQLVLTDKRGRRVTRSNFDPFLGGGLGSLDYRLPAGQSAHDEYGMDLRRYVAPARSGHYFLQAFCHNHLDLAAEDDLKGLIMGTSQLIPVTVTNPHDRPPQWFAAEIRPMWAILAAGTLLLATGVRWSGRRLPRVAVRDAVWSLVLAAVVLGYWLDHRHQSHTISRLHPDWKALWTLHLGHQ